MQSRTTRARDALQSQRLAALFVAGWLLLDFPMLRLWEGGSAWGLPSLPLALFALWALLIAVVAWWMERGDDAAVDAAASPVAPPDPWTDPAAGAAAEPAAAPRATRSPRSNDRSP